MFLGLRISLHLLVTALVAFVILRQVTATAPHASWVIALAIILFVSYIGVAFLTRTQVSPATRILWLTLVSLEGLYSSS